MIWNILRLLAVFCVAAACGGLVSRVRLPAILGWLIAGILFGPYGAAIVTAEVTDAVAYRVFIKLLECFAGVMIGREIVFRRLAASGRQILGITFVPFVIGPAVGAAASGIMKRVRDGVPRLAVFIAGLCICTLCGLAIDGWVFHSFALNYLLIGMAFSATAANLLPEEALAGTLRRYSPLLTLALVAVIVNLGMPLDYRLIAGAGAFTAVYIFARAIGKIGGAYLGGRLTHAEPVVTRYLGLTLLQHSGVSLVFTGIAVGTLSGIDPTLADIVSGTIVAAAIINEVIAVIIAKLAFRWAGEIKE